MKDFDNQKADAPQDTAPVINKPKAGAPAATRDSGHVVGEIASRSTHDADALNAPELSHPANAAPLADMLSGLQHSHGNIYVQRVVADMNQAKAGAESQSTDMGQSLDGGVRAEMESAFGENFDDVRVHTGSPAEKLNDELGARAVTRGRDIYFGAGEYNPATVEGRELLAHELTHVVQQKEGTSSSINRPGDEFEEEADHMSALAARGESVHIDRRAGAPAFQRQTTGAQRPPQASGGSSSTVFISIVGRPRGTLSNGVKYNFIAGAYALDLVLPRGVTMNLLSGNARRLNVSQPGGESAVVLEVTPNPGRSVEVEVSFSQPGVTVVGIFELPPAPQPAQPRRP